MAEWLRKMCYENLIYNRCGYLKMTQKCPNSSMTSTTMLLTLFLSSVVVTYILSQLPITSILGLGKRQTAVGDTDSSYHGTSVMLRGRQQHPVNSDLKTEALSALNLALDMQAQGKKEKALKLFQHALVLDPLHADILIEYGEFLEKHERDIVTADHLYSKALIVSPGHSRALANRQRTQPLVQDIDWIKFNRIDQKRDMLYQVPKNHPGLKRMKKEAYFLHIYHSNAIEGNTLTLAQTRSIVETRIAIGGKSLAEQNEVLGLDAALSYINNTLLQRVGAVTIEDILDIHKRVLGYVDLEEAGRVRTTQVYVGEFQPPPAAELTQLMGDFIRWLNSDQAGNLHPIEYAALAHYKLVIIHPFYDGNGRTSRLLMNLILMRAGFPPVTIRVEDRYRYYEALNIGNNGDVRPFIRFIAECTERVLDEFLFTAVENFPHDPYPQISNSNKSAERVIVVEENP